MGTFLYVSASLPWITSRKKDWVTEREISNFKLHSKKNVEDKNNNKNAKLCMRETQGEALHIPVYHNDHIEVVEVSVRF